MEFYDVITRLDGLRVGGRQDQDEGWRAWLQGLDAEALQAVQDKMEAFSRQELGITWKGWTEDVIEALSRAPEPLQSASGAFRAYALALYRASVAHAALEKLLESVLSLSSKPDTP